MTKMDIKSCILLFYIFLRNAMAFDKELAILYEFSNLRISKKTTLLEKSANEARIFFVFFCFSFCLILYQNA